MDYYFIDFETLSPNQDLPKNGAYRYINDKNCELVCGAISKNKEEPYLFDWRDPPTLEPGSCIVAHNAMFEQTICKKFIPHWVNDYEWFDTIPLVSYNGSVSKLDTASDMFRIGGGKDKLGETVRKKTLDKGIRPTDEQLKILKDYCLQDVKVCRDLFYELIGSFPAQEIEIWKLINQSNHRGIRLDEELIKTSIRSLDIEKKKIKEDVATLTNGLLYSIDQVKKLAIFLNLPNAQKETLIEALKIETDPVKIKLIGHRLNGGKKAAQKFRKAIQVLYEGRLKDNIVYYGTLTGRFSSRGFQIHNLVKAPKAEAIKNIKRIQDGDELTSQEIATVVRSVILPNKGENLISADYSQIEARILAWISGEMWLLTAFREGVPVYKEMASYIFDIPVSEVTPDQRFHGKCGVLGCGYGMGYKKCASTYSIPLKDAQIIVTKYRQKNRRVVKFWDVLEYTIRRVILDGSPRRLGKVNIYQTSRALKIRLPSGRSISYLYPEVDEDDNITFLRPRKAGMFRESYWGGTFTENICQGIARDIICEAMLRLDKEDKYSLLFNVHDELVYSAKKDASLDRFVELVVEKSEWLNGLPISCEADSADRYYKT